MLPRSKLFAAAVLLLALAPLAGDARAQEPAYEGALFKRVTLVVADLERALTIYRDILGFQLDGISESSADSYSYPVFRIDPSAKIRFATLSAGEEQVRTLALTEVKGMDLPAPGVPLRSASVIRSRDLERDFRRLEALGLETTEPKFVAGREFDFWERAFVDFDGHLIVLYQIVDRPPPAAAEPPPVPELPGVQISEEVPAAALDLELLDLDGNRRRLGELVSAGGALLVFTANTCPYAVDWLDRLPRLAAKARAQDMAFVLVNSNERRRRAEDSPEEMAELAAEQGFDFPYWIDSEARLAAALGARRTPEVFVFDADRRLAYRGAIDDHSGPLAQVGEHWTLDALGQLAAGQPILKPVTTPLGCSVLGPRRSRRR